MKIKVILYSFLFSQQHKWSRYYKHALQDRKTCLNCTYYNEITVKLRYMDEQTVVDYYYIIILDHC